MQLNFHTEGPGNSEVMSLDGDAALTLDAIPGWLGRVAWLAQSFA